MISSALATQASPRVSASRFLHRFAPDTRLTDMDLRRLRFPVYAGDRLTVRMDHRDREALRTLSTSVGVSESELARQAISALLRERLPAEPHIGR